MEIVKRGTAHLRDVFCDKCKSKLKYGPQDVYYSGDKSIAAIQCPVCDNTIIINQENKKPKKNFKFWWCK